MLELNDLHAHYGLNHVLQGVALSVGAKEVVGLFGRSGAGKSTVIKAIGGCVRPSHGSIRFMGAALDGLGADAICRLGIGYVPQDRRVFSGLTVEQHLTLALPGACGQPAAESQRMLAHIYHLFPRLHVRRAQPGSTLSVGEQHMLAIARVLAGAPKLLLIDEPTEGLAPMFVEEIFSIIEGLRDSGISILLVEENVRRALEVAQRFYLLERGQVILQGDASSAIFRRALMMAMSVAA